MTLRPASSFRNASGFALASALLSSSMLSTVGCSKPPPPPPAAETRATPEAPPANSMPQLPPGHGGMMVPGHGKPGAADGESTVDLEWTAPAAWTKAENPSPMRKATYKIPKAAGDDEVAEMSVSQVGGGLDANIERWAGQFEGGATDKKRTEKTVGTMKVTLVEMSGTFAGMGGMGRPAKAPKKDQALLAAIADPEPPYPPYFFKMVGGKKTIAAARADFDKFVGTFKTKKK